MQLSVLLVYALLIVPALSETLLSGAVYFDSKNTLIEVRDLIKSGNVDGLATIIKSNHISEKTKYDQEVILLVSGFDSESPVEFRFASDPTTYWTYAKYVSTKPVAAAPSPSSSPIPASTLPGGSPSNLTSTMPLAREVKPTPSPVAIPSPTPTPIPVRKSEEKGIAAHSPLLKHKRPAVNNDSNDDVPESAKIWHQVNGHWKWYDKRLLHEIRRALPVTGTPTPAPLPSNIPPAQP